MTARTRTETQIFSLQTLILDLPPSCIEFCPAHPSYFLVGTYNLQKDKELKPASKTQSRNGSIVLFHLPDDKNLTLVETLDQQSAILDLHFQTHPDRTDICGVVSSTATFSVVRLSHCNADGPKLDHLGTLRVPGVKEDVLFTAFCWHPTLADVAAVSASTGHIRLLRLDANFQGLETRESPIMTHGLEAWCVAIHAHVDVPSHALDDPLQNPAAITLISGGDDSALNYGTILMASSPTHPLTLRLPHPPKHLLNVHQAGVTAALPLPIQDPEDNVLVLTGSYDDTVALLRIAPLHLTHGARKVTQLVDKKLGGGVWRLKLVEVEESGDGWRALILASCMHAGARILDTQKNGEKYEIKVLARFEEHESMTYGSDFQPGWAREGAVPCVSTSFYDRRLCLWETKMA